MKKILLLLMLAFSLSATSQIEVELADTVPTSKGGRARLELVMSSMEVLYADSIYHVTVNFLPYTDTIVFNDSTRVKVFQDEVPCVLRFESTTYPTAHKIRVEYRKLLRSRGRKPRG